MTGISKNWVTIADAAVDPDSPIDSILMFGLRDDLVHLREWLGASYTAGAVQDHNHDGVNSAAIDIGANAVRNGSFESGSSGWTLTAYTGGTIGVQTTGAMHGKYCLAITSTVLANGGGNALSAEYTSVSPGRRYLVSALLKASVANISHEVAVIWYNTAKSQISATQLQNANTSTTQRLYGRSVAAPANAAYASVKVTGGVPALGSATGTIYVDGVAMLPRDFVYPPVLPGTVWAPMGAGDSTAGSWSEVVNRRIMQRGIYRIYMQLTNCCFQTTGNTYGQLYKNGSAIGGQLSGYLAYNGTTIISSTQDLEFEDGDTLQFMTYNTSGGATHGWSVKVGCENFDYVPPIGINGGDRV